jgi:hypothetical protein
MNEQLSVESTPDLVVARLRGTPTPELLVECQERVVELVKETGRGRVLYDTLEMFPPHVDVALSQRDLDAGLADVTLRRAIVVPNARLAYLARLAFGEGDYRVFYGDLAGARAWLTSGENAPLM